MPFISRFILLLGALLISACAQQAPAFAPPSERPLAASEKPWPKNHEILIYRPNCPHLLHTSQERHDIGS